MSLFAPGAGVRGRCRRLAALALSCVVFAACGSAGTRSPSAGASDASGPSPSASIFADACSYMTIPQASEALGSPIDTATPVPGALGCVYEINGSPIVIGYQFADEAYWTEAKTGTHTGIDLGDEAFYVTDADFTTFVIRHGTTYLSVVVHIPSSSAKSAVDVGTAITGYVLAGVR
jgi:hypothetical protein